ncbi:MAG: ATP-dependent Clp protease ATP-binding subunit, partial [Actinobacteria bacterium]|nr:ATP-dependent Clp protease ATP-binding subunit [Actinomycetota bacterium]
ESGKLVLSHARRIAAELRAELLEAEHLFLGVCQIDDPAIAASMHRAGIDLTAVCRSLRRRLSEGAGRGGPDVRVSPECAAVLERARQVAAHAGERLVEVHHILVALLADDRGLVARILDESGVDARAAQIELTGIVESGEVTPPDFYRSRRSVERADLGKAGELLETLGRDLTLAAETGRLSSLIGRDREIAEVVKILLGRRKNNALLIGEAGVGKTAVVEGLAQRIVEGAVPGLAGMRIRTIEVGSLVAGTTYRGQFEQRLKDLIDAVRDRDDIILFIDEMHMLVGAGEAGTGGSVDAANILKPVLSEGVLKVIGATTTDEYRRYLEPDRALMRRFQPVVVGEPSREDALTILRGLRHRYEEFHVVRVGDGALEAAVDLSVRFVHDRRLPDKALDLLDRACTNVKLEATPGPAGGGGEPPEVTAEDIAVVVSVLLEIPIARLTEDERSRLAEMPARLRGRVIGQDHVIDAVSQAILRARTGFASPDRPVGVFLLLGPTGVGKTKMAEELAAILFGTREELIAFDMSQYNDPYSVSELLGQKTGMSGWQEGGKLANAVRGKPYSVVLLDEIEKAHPDVWNLFLPVFDNGRITDTLGRVIDFRNTVVLMTSNVGARRFRAGPPIGFAASEASGPPELEARDVVGDVTRDLHDVFPPEFLNRIDDVLVFEPLTRDHIRQIVRRRIGETAPVRIVPTPEALEHLVEASYDPAMGARPVRRAVQRLVANPLSLLMARAEIGEGDEVEMSLADGGLAFRRIAPA